MARDIATELKSFVRQPKLFPKSYGSVAASLSRFYDARMDQVRIYHALKASEVLLEVVDARAAFAFQEAVLQKERSKQIVYHSQRDHTCHTLNNFVLGWYIYKNSPTLRNSFIDAFEKRSLGIGKPEDAKFASTWLYVSLLHDVGYIFEGDFSDPAEFQKNVGIKAAIACLKDYFDDKFWKHNRLSSADKKTLFDEKLVREFNISASSMEELSNCLQTMDGLGPSLKEVERLYSKHVGDIDKAFDLWSKNYEFFSNTKMADKIRKLGVDFVKLRTEGINKGGPKILNHGVCSGLILLQFVTYYYMLYLVIDRLKREDRLSNLTQRYDQKARTYSIDLWWSGLVWATAATAIHDRYQALVDDKVKDDKLSFSDDPLAFLGILVDEMQLWDRFSVFDPTKGHKFDEIPTQSSDVRLKVDPSMRKIAFSAPPHEIDKLVKSLDARLEDWKEIVFLDTVN